MKVISLLQPWASLVVMGHKRIETRSWNTSYRGEVLIHASLGKRYSKAPFTISCRELCYKTPFIKFIHPGSYDELPFGAIIGSVNLDETVDTETINAFPFTLGGYHDLTEQERAFGDYSQRRYGWYLSNPVKFEVPTPAKGSLSIWNFDESLLINFKRTGKPETF